MTSRPRGHNQFVHLASNPFSNNVEQAARLCRAFSSPKTGQSKKIVAIVKGSNAFPVNIHGNT